jgi:hypothetical protein
MAKVVSINGRNPMLPDCHNPCSEAKPDENKQVYGCGTCKAQGHRLLPENEIICGSCSAPSSFMWFEQDKKPVDNAKRLPRLAVSKEDHLDHYVCRRCSFTRFHLHPSGTLTCYRCRHAASYKWWWPEGELA